MKPVVAPLSSGDRGTEVVNLQQGLTLLLNRGIIDVSQSEREELLKDLSNDMQEERYADGTAKIVLIFQQQQRLEASTAVDEPTAVALNSYLRASGAFDGGTGCLSYTVAGQVVYDDGAPFRGSVYLFSHADESTIRVGEDAADPEGRYAIRYQPVEDLGKSFLRVAIFDTQGRTLAEQTIEAAKMVEIVDLTVQRGTAQQPRIEGRVVFEHGQPASQISLRLYRRNFGGQATLVGQAITQTDGQYTLLFSLNDQGKSFEIRGVKSTTEEIVLSKGLNDLGLELYTLLNLVAPMTLQPLTAEYGRLTTALTPHVTQIARLADAKENTQRQDLTVLNRTTGWDARLIALAATAERLVATGGVTLSQEGLYGLFRTGLPSDKLVLAQVGSDVVERALKKARDAGVISLNDTMIGQFKQQFEIFATSVRLSVPAPGSRSTYGDLLGKAGLNADGQSRFAKAYLAHRGDGDLLWDSARAGGLDNIQISKLQLQGKLAFLTGNSATLTERLQGTTTNPAQLVDRDLYRTDTWIDEIDLAVNIPPARRDSLTNADKQNLEALIPPAYVAGTIEARRRLWAEDMARKVRLSYPTRVVARIAEQDSADPFKLGTARTSTSTLLKNAAAQGFRLGTTPVAAFLKLHTGVKGALTDSEFQAAQQNVKMLQRVYQITPTNEAMPVLISLGLTSAYDVVAVSEQVFLDLYGTKFPTLEQARLVYHKAKQVSNVTYNLFTVAKTLESSLPIHGMSAPAEVREGVRNELIKNFPTMESLFGSMDFCECEHCRSVLSPAAYLVDLLQFVDTEPEVWGNFLNHWKANHNNQEYTAKYKQPYDALIERRPDLPHIPLTCENTHTALPYIDIVNEILEYYVANDRLAKDAARDTGDATTAELLAEPQNVIREAYDKLRDARYPLALPFDLWVETVRQFCDYFETPLARVLEVFRPGEQLVDREREFIESLGLSLAEWAIFTDAAPLTNDKWHELYGYLALRSALQNPTNTTNATLTIIDADALRFRAGDLCTYFDVSANALHTEAKTISAIGAAGSGGTGRTTITFTGTWTTPPVATDQLMIATLTILRSAKALSRRLGVTYKELVEIVQAGFVNPKLEKLVLLQRMGVSIHSVQFCRNTQNKAFYDTNKDLLDKDRATLSTTNQQRYDALTQADWQKLREVQAYEQRLLDFGTAFKLTPTQIENELAAIPFDDILVLADPDAGCNFDLTTLRYASGRAADEIAFLKINLFTRLWRKLGWTIEETDRALQVFVPRQTPFDKANLNRQPLKTALIYLAHLAALDKQVRVGKQSRLKLLTLWADLATTGKKPLYGQLFLARSVLKNDDVFDNPLGQYLSSAGITALAQSRWHRVQLERVASADQINPTPFAGSAKVQLAYDALQEVQYLGYQGILSNSDETTLRALSTSPALPKLLDAVQAKAADFALIKGHLAALQGALGLAGDEIGRILEDAGKSLDTAELSLPHVSLLYRYGLLAKALKLPIADLIALKQLSGLDPFKLLYADPPATLDDDYPFAQTLRFVAVAAQIKDSGLTIEDLAYLLRHRFDETGTYRPNREGTLALLKTLAEGVRAIRAEHAVPDDPGAMTEEVLRQKLGLVLPSDVVEPFLAMLNGTAEFTATKTGVALADKLQPAAFADEPVIREVRYNQARQEQKLTFRGVLFNAQKTALLGRLPKPAPEQPHVPSPLLSTLLNDVQQQALSFFAKHLQKQAPNVQPTTGFLDSADFGLLFDPELALGAGESQQDRVRNRRAKLAQAFLPFLQQRLIRQFIVQTLTAHTAADPLLVESLLTDARLLGEVQSGGGTRPLLDVLAATAERGLTATFFASANLSGSALSTVALADADLALKDKNGNPLKPAGTNSARLEGYLEVGTPGAYRFYAVMGKQNAQAELRFAHLPGPTLTGTATADGDEVGDGPAEYAELKPGVLYRFTLELRSLNGGTARLLAQGETQPKDRLALLPLYPLATMAAAERASGLLTKTLQLLQSLGLGEREARYLLTHASDFANLDLKQLPTQPADDTPTNARMLFARFLRLAGYARLKRDLADGTDDLIAIFEANGTGDLNKVYPLLARLTRRDEATVRATAKAVLGDTPAFASEEPLRRLWEALQVVAQFGVPVASLVEWTRIASLAATPEQRFGIARDLKEAIKARFEGETWQRVAQPIFDKLRRRQRDTLVAHVMHQHSFARMEQLYEYFLIDPGMEPVVQTSRIRLAIGSVQLFIQRSLLNLEPKVHPTAIINAKQWEWMKRYRVWEANRKIFLFPENWLEPEFRDDKTHLFSELESALLQGDVSSDLVEDAFLNYLRKLEELARLDIVAMHLEDKVDPAQNVLHVIGRTYSQPHKYFYRRYAHQMWTPWSPISAEIEGDHLAPVIWRDRLYLFWATFIEKVDQPSTAGFSNGSKHLTDVSVSQVVGDLRKIVAKKQVEVHLHWSEYFQGEWSTRESGSFATVLSKSINTAFKPKEVFIHVSKEPGDGGVFIHLGGLISKAFFLAGRNSAPEGVTYSPKPDSPYGLNTLLATRYSGSGKLAVTFKQRITTEPGKEPTIETPDILRESRKYTLVPCDNNITLGAPDLAALDAENPAAVAAAIESGLADMTALMKPIFYQDNTNTLFVEPNVTERTIEEWKEWVVHTPLPEPDWQLPDWWDDIVVIPEVPRRPIPIGHGPYEIDDASIFTVKPGRDWLVNPGTGLVFEGQLIGPGGLAGLEIRPAAQVAGAIEEGATPVHVHGGSGIASGSVVVVAGAATFEKSGLAPLAGGLNVISGTGFNAALEQNRRLNH